jgi:hypothetical protein
MCCQVLMASIVTASALGWREPTSQPPSTDVLPSPETAAAAHFPLTDRDKQLLDEVEHGCFLYFWREVGTPAKLVKDRYKAPVASIAAVGFQLSALPIGVERGWITREQGRQRARTVLTSLVERHDNKKLGIYLHFPDHNSGGPSQQGYEVLCSTVDTALLIAGAIPAGEYFGGEVKILVDRMIAEANWRAYGTSPEGFICMGWKPDDPSRIAGNGAFHSSHWNVASDEERLIYFLAVGAPVAEHAVGPRAYYQLRRVMKRHEDMPPYVVSWPGALFTYFFSHCWIDYRALGSDHPSRFGVSTPTVDWFENSRRAVLTHRRRCLEQEERFKTLSSDRWGLSACVGREGYIVPMVQPNLAAEDRWFEGTVAPYAAAAAIMFAPRESLAAIRAFRELRDTHGQPLVWRDPAHGGYGFADAFNLDQHYVSDDYVGIDQGPMLLAIENARTGLIWKLFMQHDTARRAVARLGLAP